MPIPLIAPPQPLLGQGAALGPAPRPSPAMSAVEIEVDDATGRVTVRDRSKPVPAAKAESFDDNLAEKLDDSALGAVAELLLRGIEADERSRKEMLDQYSRGMDLLGLKLDGDAAGFAAGQGGKNISRIRHPILLWACVRFQSGARNELLPAAGPVKARIDGDDTGARQELAKDFERDFNHYLTVTASEYYPDTDRGLFYLGYGGTLFKKVYHCPLRERPVSECVYMPDLIVSNDATDLMNAQRVTHRFEMAQNTVRRLQQEGFYLDIALAPPTENTIDPAKQKAAQIAGVQPQREQQEDRQHTIFECYTELDLAPHGVTEAGARDGRPLPYRVSIDRDGRKILEIRRNWKASDPGCRRRKRFVKYGLIPGFGFYDYGFLHLIGNHTKALTALWRLLIDAGMFSTFPGGLRLKGSRASTNEFRPGPGEFPEIDAAGVEDIRKLIMAMPYKEPSAVILQMIDMLMKDAAQIAGTVELELGEGRTNMPVGTILSMIEQQTQVMSAVHKRNHASQQEELLLLKELFAEDPTALARFNPDPAHAWAAAAEFQDLTLVPASDPNVPAQIHRIMQSTVLWMMGTQAPQLFNQQEVVRRILRTINIGDIDSLLSAAPAAPPAGPTDAKAAAAAAELPLKQQKLALSQQELLQQQAENQREATAQAIEMQQRQQDRALKAAIESAKLAHAREKLAAGQAGPIAAATDNSTVQNRQEGGGVDGQDGRVGDQSAPVPAQEMPPSDGTRQIGAAPAPAPPEGSAAPAPDQSGFAGRIAQSRIPVGVVDDQGKPVLDEDGNPMQRPSDVPPSFFVDAGLAAAAAPDIESPGATSRALLVNFRQGGPWDVQRIGSDHDPTHQFINYATVGIGLYGAAAGIPIDELLFYQNLYAARFSDFGDDKRDPVYTHLAEKNVINTRRGYELYNSGQIGPSATQ